MFDVLLYFTLFTEVSFKWLKSETSKLQSFVLLESTLSLVTVALKVGDQIDNKLAMLDVLVSASPDAPVLRSVNTH